MMLYPLLVKLIKEREYERLIREAGNIRLGLEDV
jgi:hypothetical protein